MTRLLHKSSSKTGVAPGTLVLVGKDDGEPARLTVFEYDPSACTERRGITVEECLPYRDTKATAWINLDGVRHVDLVERLGAHFGIHPLVLEDIVNTNQRPKLDIMGDYLFVVFRMLTWDEAAGEVRSEQVSLVLGKLYVLSFQERVGDVFDPLRERLRKGLGRIRTGGADYLAYALLDVIVDNYFVVVERLDEQIEALETRLVSQPTPEVLGHLNRLKRQALFLRKSIWPLREAVAGLQRRESPLIGETTALYLRDLYDHVIHVIDTVETLRDLLAGMLDVYLSGVSNRMNEIMKVLTVISTIFIPLTFIVGVYGMNFEFMPELHHKNAYPLVWGVMLAVAGALALYFRRRRWV
jgi:magnesium transporter